MERALTLRAAALSASIFIKTSEYPSYHDSFQSASKLGIVREIPGGKFPAGNFLLKI
jgi:hypothetical protein